ncbi:MAG: hypothetical protein ACOCX4_08610 [Planctomycetota bacterium]
MQIARLEPELVDSLARRRPDHGVSCLMPAHPRGPECRQDPIRLRNLADEAAAQLRAMHVHDPESRVAALRDLQEDMGFWEQNGAPGLAFYLMGGALDVVALRSPPEALSVVDGCYHLTPLLPAVNRNETFHILALGQGGVRLFRADRGAVEELTLPDAPDDFGEILGQYMQDDHLQYHSGTATRDKSGDRRAMYHGQGVATDATDRKKKLDEYCRRIEAAVSDRLGESRASLLLAATEPLAGLYRNASRDPRLEPRTLEGSPERERPEDLHRRAVALLDGQFDADRRAAIEAFGAAESQGQAVREADAVLQAAHVGQVGTLFLREDAHLWGTYDPESSSSSLTGTPQAGASDLLNRAAVETLRHDGRVFLVGHDEFAAADPMAATLRYTTPA